jgi:hypothetical protein
MRTKRTSGAPLRIKTRTLSAHGFSYTTHMVVGRDASGLRLRKCFKSREDATAFIAGEQTRILNAETATRPVNTRLTSEQLHAAESAFTRLGARHTLDEAVSYFLDNYASPDETITLKSAVEKFSEGKSDVRANTLRNIKSTVNRFRDHVGGDIELHMITEQNVRDFLGSLRSKDGEGDASKKTWNNARNDVSSFLTWCMERERRWVTKNVAREVTLYDRKALKKMGVPDILSPEQACKLMAAAAKHEPSLAKLYALMLFAGVRPDGELHKLVRDPKVERLIKTNTRAIHITADTSKVHEDRTVAMSENLAKWLSLPGPLLPTNAVRHIKSFRATHALSQDVCRHSFCTFHVATHGSLAKTAIEAGNSEGVIKRHYYQHASAEEAAPFWRIVPDKKKGAVIAPDPEKRKAPRKPGRGQ